MDYAFLGDKDDTETLVIQVARDVWSGYLFAHAVPRKGLTHEHGAKELIKDVEQLGHTKVIIKTDGEPAMKSFQEEVKARREHPTILDNL